MKKKPSGIHPIYKCVKFQHYCIIFDIILNGRKKDFQKMKNDSPRYSSNLQVSQISE